MITWANLGLKQP